MGRIFTAITQILLKINCRAVDEPKNQKDLRPRQTRIRRGESKSAGFFFVGAMFSLVLKTKRPKNDHRNWNPEDLGSPRREISNGGLVIVVALLVCWHINFVCASG